MFDAANTHEASSIADVRMPEEAPWMSYFNPTRYNIKVPVISENIRGTIDMHVCASFGHGITTGNISEAHRLSSMTGSMERPAI